MEIGDRVQENLLIPQYQTDTKPEDGGIIVGPVASYDFGPLMPKFKSRTDQVSPDDI
jgi:hypothetical protein